MAFVAKSAKFYTYNMHCQVTK